MVKPFLKWVGGKTQILPKIMSKIPLKFNNYHEIFVGGGSILLAILTAINDGSIKLKGEIYAYDINIALIYTYINIQKKIDKVCEYIKLYMTKYDTIIGDEVNRKPSTIEEALTSKESYYYWLRHKFNSHDKQSCKVSALFIILNKLCFRGLYREGPNGFNVPFGHYKTTPTISESNLREVSSLIKDVHFKCIGFEDSISTTIKGDFMYLDPPYIPLNKTSFTGYNVDGFDHEQHKKLFKMIISASNRGVKFLLSNSNTDYIKNKFKVFSIEELECRRAINSKDPSSTATEVLISKPCN